MGALLETTFQSRMTHSEQQILDVKVVLVRNPILRRNYLELVSGLHQFDIQPKYLF